MNRIPKAGGAVASVLLLVLLIPALAHSVTPDIVYPVQKDQDQNLIDDALDARIAQAVDALVPEVPLRVVVTLYQPPTPDDYALVRRYGSLVHVYRHATYGFAGYLPANRIGDLASLLGSKLCIIEPDLPGGATLDDAARHIRARPLVWHPSTGYGLDGDPDIVIAIFDTGIDETHTDLSGGRVVFWHDFTQAENELTSTDRNGHGSHVSGIAAGTGASIGSGAVSTLTTTMSGFLPLVNGNGYADMIKVPVVGSGQVTSNLEWSGTGSSQINLATSSAGWIYSHVSSTSPNVWTWSISSADVYKARAGNSSGAGGEPYAMLTTYPYAAVGDGFNLFRGIAPTCELAGFKILEQDGSGWSSDWTAAFDSLVVVNSLYNIKVANASVALYNGGTDTALRTAVNSCVNGGTVVVISAGNDYPAYNIADPGRAANAITVGAVNDFSAMTDYSSNGASGSNKPDVVAPGGSHSWNSNVGSEITSCDTNVNEAATSGFADRNANDYSNMFGTSMAAPTVAGTAALVIDALETYEGYNWMYTSGDALTVKSIILMTATETNQNGEESCGNNPTLNRGGKDLVEGYGKINADAAVEAVINSLTFPPDTTLSITFGAGVFDRQCWASDLALCGPETLTVTLEVPANADFDLYLYDVYYGLDGEPHLTHSSAHSSLGTDESITLELGYWCVAYYVVAKRVSGSGLATLKIRSGSGPTAVDAQGAPAYAELRQNYPNPFTAHTTVPYVIPGPESRRVELRVYSASGALVNTIVDDVREPGVHQAFWNGLDSKGRRVASGVYFARLDVGDRVLTRRMTLVR